MGRTVPSVGLADSPASSDTVRSGRGTEGAVRAGADVMATLHRNLSIFPEVHVEAKNDPVFVGENSRTELDPDWSFIDENGHGHFVDKNEPKGDRLPTLRWVPEACSMGHGDDCDSEGHYVCLI